MIHRVAKLGTDRKKGEDLWSNVKYLVRVRTVLLTDLMKRSNGVQVLHLG